MDYYTTLNAQAVAKENEEQNVNDIVNWQIDEPRSDVENVLTGDDVKLIGLAVDIPPNKPMRTDFKQLKMLGKGGYGKVWLVQKTTGCDVGEHYAMKILQKANITNSKKDTIHIRAERNVMGHVKHPFIVNLLYAFQTQRKLYMVMPFMAGADLFSYMEKIDVFKEDEARFFVCELVLALEYLHENGVIYRDLKPENILLDLEGHIKLTDFGLCKEYIDDITLTHTFCGTIEYMAPEIVDGNGHGKAVDWWSLGVLFFDMLLGYPPFISSDRRILKNLIKKARIIIPPFFSSHAQSLVKQLLRRKPNQRLGGGPRGAGEIKRHAFFSGIDWDDVLLRKLKSPVNPIQGIPGDTSNFSSKFTDQEPNDSLDDSYLSDSAKKQFEGFSYIADSFLEYYMENSVTSALSTSSADLMSMNEAVDESYMLDNFGEATYESLDELVCVDSDDPDFEEVDESPMGEPSQYGVPRVLSVTMQEDGDSHV